MQKFSPPFVNVAEVTLIGTGGGYGESCVVHLGNSKWIVIDSCIDSKTGNSLPLEYLNSMGVQVNIDVVMVICTHWHDDHIQGLAQLFTAAECADLCFARANDLKKFLQFVKIDVKKAKVHASISSTNEFNACIDLLNKRRKHPKWASADRTLLNILVNGKSCSLHSLSPSDYTMQNFDRELSTLMDKYVSRDSKVIAQSPNAKSVALYVKFGEKHRVLLGADLEVGKNTDEGWLNILNHSTTIETDKKASLFKIPHHGSFNGYHDRIWAELLTSNPIAKLTPWNLNGKLPPAEMLHLICEHSSNVFMTSKIVSLKAKKRDKAIEKIIKHFEYKILEPKSVSGIVQCRIAIDDNEAKWDISLFDEAIHVNRELKTALNEG